MGHTGQCAREGCCVVEGWYYTSSPSPGHIQLTQAPLGINIRLTLGTL